MGLRAGAVLLLCLISGSHADTSAPCLTWVTQNIYGFQVPVLEDYNQTPKNVSLGSVTEGKWTILTNLASFCGLTPQVLDMNAVQSQAPTQGVNFTIVGFPCNQFNLQMPGDNRTEIVHLFEYVRPGNGYIANFPWFGAPTINVNGEGTLPLYQFLKNSCPPYQAALSPRSLLNYDPVASGDVTWNFEKFLINPSGIPVRRFSPDVTVREIYNEYILPNN